MNKINNNLTIENLIKTEWFNQFDENQKKEILEGLEDNLDVLYMLNLHLIGNKCQKLDLVYPST